MHKKLASFFQMFSDHHISNLSCPATITATTVATTTTATTSTCQSCILSMVHPVNCASCQSRILHLLRSPLPLLWPLNLPLSLSTAISSVINTAATVAANTNMPTTTAVLPLLTTTVTTKPRALLSRLIRASQGVWGSAAPLVISINQL